MEKIWKRDQKIKGIFITKSPPFLFNASDFDTQSPSETRKTFDEAFASISATENYTNSFQRFKRTQEAERKNFHQQ